MKDADINVVGLSSNKSKGKTNWKILGSIIGIIVLAVGVIAGIVLVKQNQNINENAKECSAGGYQCPSTTDPTLLRDCSTGEVFPNDARCDTAGRVEVCGSTASNAKQFCCPSAGAAWTTNLTLCAVASTPTATAIATSTATSTSSSIATATATSTSTSKSTSTTKATSTSKSTSTTKATSTSKSTATAVPIPVTGASWPTILGAGFGVVMILISISLAL